METSDSNPNNSSVPGANGTSSNTIGDYLKRESISSKLNNLGSGHLTSNTDRNDETGSKHPWFK